jgi:hypothetical protein
MGVDEPQSFQAGGGRAVGVEAGDHDLPVIPDDDVVDFTLTADEDGELPVYFAGEFTQDPGQFVGQNPVGGDFSPVELFDSPELSGPEAGKVAINAMDVNDLLLWLKANGEKNFYF